MAKIQTLKSALRVVDTRIGRRLTPATPAARSGGTTTERGYGWDWQQLRERILRRDRYQCQACLSEGRLAAATEVDHRTPKHLGGSDDPANLQSLCKPCHRAKSAAEEAARRGWHPPGG
jgi:5-methylcytosine-specific restriction endonuclease McrA